MSQTLKEKFEQAGKDWLAGSDVLEWNYGQKKLKFFDQQIRFINNRDKRESLYYGAFAAGKSVSLYVRCLMMALFFPNNLCLIGRRNYSEIEKIVLPDLLSLIPTNWYIHHVKNQTIEFPWNGSKISLVGLETMVSENLQDRKKAIAAIRGMNLGFIGLDQAESLERSIYEALSGRLRRDSVPCRFIGLNANPSPCWLYQEFIQHPRDDVLLIQGSMASNPSLPKDFIDSQLAKDSVYQKKFVEGIWDSDTMTQKCVFSKDFVLKIEETIKEPLLVENDFLIWQEPRNTEKYFIGVDGSMSSYDKNAIAVVSSEGVLVARWIGFSTIPGVVDKINYIYDKYHLVSEPLLLVETASSGVALIEQTMSLRHYRRRVYEVREKKEIEKVGWFTSYASKALLISHFQELLQQGFFKAYDRELVEQMRVFEYRDTARSQGASASPGFADDLLMATMIACIEVAGEKKITPEELRRLKSARDERIATKIKRATHPRWREYQ